MMDLSYEFEEIDDGSMVVSCSDGRYFDAGLIAMLFDLHNQNPEFFQNWIALAENYVLVGNSVGEA
ncbi:MAG: hypothetical protein LC650_02540 [Actinobacteria bacterium]|nr:hypothetical protein [Actinomycetota bacterium]